MRIVQVLSGIFYGDGVSNYAIKLDEFLKQNGYECLLMANKIDRKFADIAELFRSSKLRKDDIIFYHMCTASDLTLDVACMPAFKVMLYHNITPPHFYHKYNKDAEIRNICAYSQLSVVINKFDLVMTFSEFSKKCLIQLGCQTEMVVVPYFVDISWSANTNQKTASARKDTASKFLSVGRMVPHEKFEDTIRVFAAYQKLYEPQASLLLIGDQTNEKRYCEDIKLYTTSLHLNKNVVFKGHVSNQEVCSCYQQADAYLCFSEYEGFCIPIVDAMANNVPVIAYDAAAIKGTLDGAGILVDTKDPLIIASLLWRLKTDMAFRDTILAGQQKRFQALKSCDGLEKFLNQVVSETVQKAAEMRRS